MYYVPMGFQHLLVIIGIVILSQVKSNKSSIEKLHVSPTGHVLVKISNGGVSALSYDLKVLPNCRIQVNNVIEGGVAVDHTTGLYTICLLNNTCIHQLNLTNCQSVANLSVSFHTNSHVLLHLEEDVLFVAYPHSSDGLQLMKFLNGSLTWNETYEANISGSLTRFYAVNNSLYITLISIQNDFVTIFKITDEGNWSSLEYQVKIQNYDEQQYILQPVLISYFGEMYILVPFNQNNHGFVKIVALSLLHQFCESNETSTCSLQLDNESVIVKSGLEVTGNITSMETTDSFYVYISYQSSHASYISKFFIESIGNATIVSDRLLSVNQHYQLVWNQYWNIMYCVSDNVVLKFNEKFHDDSLNETETFLQLHLDNGVKSGVDFQPQLYISLVTSNSDFLMMLQNQLQCIVQSSCENITIVSPFSECVDLISNRNYSLYNFTLFSRNQHLLTNLSSQLLLVDCSSHHRCARSLLNQCAINSENCVCTKLASNDDTPVAFIKSVQPTKIIPAGGNIINFFGGNFVSGNIQLICGNIFHKLICGYFNKTVISNCVSPRLNSTKCKSIQYNDQVSVSLSHIGLVVSPNPRIGDLSYTVINEHRGKLSITIFITGRHLSSVSGSQVSVLVGQNECQLSSQTDSKIQCMTHISRTGDLKMSFVVVVTMAGISYNKTVAIEYYDDYQDTNLSFVPIIVVVIILLASLTILILGAVGASFWTRKRRKDLNKRQMQPRATSNNKTGRDSRVARNLSEMVEENIYESIQECQLTVGSIEDRNFTSESKILGQSCSVPDEQYIPMHSADVLEVTANPIN